MALAQQDAWRECEVIGAAMQTLSMGGVTYQTQAAALFDSPERFGVILERWRRDFALVDAPREFSVPFGIVLNWAVPVGGVDVFASITGSLACVFSVHLAAGETS